MAPHQALLPIPEAQPGMGFNSTATAIANSGGHSHSNAAKRRRVARACDACRRKKIRCDGAQPCMHCTVYSYACTFDQPSPRRRQQTQEQVDVLASRCLRAERLLRAFGQKDGVFAPGSEEGPVLLPREVLALEAHLGLPEWQEPAESPEGDSPPSAHSLVRGKSPSKQLESMIDGVGELHVDSEGQSEYRGDSSGTRFTHSICSQVLDGAPAASDDIYGFGESLKNHLQSRSRESIKTDPSEKTANKIEVDQADLLADVDGDAELPPRKVGEALIDLCFDHALSSLQFFHPPSFRVEMDKTYTRFEKGEDLEEDVFLPVLFAAMAVGCIYCNAIKDELEIEDPKLRAFQYFQVSKQRSDPLTRANYLVLQTLLCQALFLQSTANMSVCWSHLGLALKCAQRMGIQRQLDTAFPPKERHLRKKIFWTLRNLDMYLHAVLGLPRGIDEEDYDQAPVEEVDDEFVTDQGVGQQPADRPSIYLAANEATKLMTVLGRIVRQVYPLGRDQGRATVSQGSIAALEQALQYWHDHLPSHLTGPKEADKYGPIYWRLTTLLHFTFHHTQFLLYRPFLHYITESEHPHHQAYAKRCKAAAFAILDVTARVLDREPQLFGHILTLYATFFAGLILFYCLIQEHAAPMKERELCMAQAEIAIRAMEVCSSCSFAAERCLEILKQMKRQVQMDAAGAARRAHSVVREVKNERRSSSSGSSKVSVIPQGQTQSQSQAPSKSAEGPSRKSSKSSITSTPTSASAKTVQPVGSTSEQNVSGRANKKGLSLAGAMPGPDPAFVQHQQQQPKKSQTKDAPPKREPGQEQHHKVPSQQHETEQPTGRPTMPSRLNPSFSNLSSMPDAYLAMAQPMPPPPNQNCQQTLMQDDNLALGPQEGYPDFAHLMSQQALQVMGTPQTFDFDGVSDTYQPSNRTAPWMSFEGNQAFGQGWMGFMPQGNQIGPEQRGQAPVPMQGQQQGQQPQAGWPESEWPTHDYQDSQGDAYMYQ